MKRQGMRPEEPFYFVEESRRGIWSVSGSSSSSGSRWRYTRGGGAGWGAGVFDGGVHEAAPKRKKY